ncbi:MAG TPA: DUF1259 domain-containing protein [Gemmatimonadota bacterium]|jgi:hypothetical protein
MRATKSRLGTVCAAAVLALSAIDCGRAPGDEPADGARPGARAPDGFDTAAVDTLPGAPGVLDRESGTYRLSIPRDDLVVTVDGSPLAPGTDLEGRVTLVPVPGGAVLTAELPMLVDEVNPVISAALLHNLAVTGLHTHFARDEPRVWYLHLAGIGETDSLAAGVGAVLRTLEDVKGQPRETPPVLDATTTLSPAAVDSVLRLRGQRRQGAYEFTLPRSTRFDGYDLDAASGISTRVTFAGSDARARAGGRFAVTQAELQPVLRALRAGGIDIFSIDDPLAGEEPRLYFVHFQGRGRAIDLARAVRDALDALATSGG